MTLIELTHSKSAMAYRSVASLILLVSTASAAFIPSYPGSSAYPNIAKGDIQSQGGCENTPTSRQCWGNYSVDTNWYDDTPYTGVTREYWLVAQNQTLAPD